MVRNSPVKARPTHRFTYGLKGSSVLAALTNGVLLLVATGAILLEAAQRLARPQPVSGSGIMIVAAIGIVVNGITAWLFARGRKGDLNIRAACLHMMADAAIAASVIVAGGLILLTGKYWIDPLASIGVALVVLAGTYRLLRESVAMSLDAVPARLDVRDVEHELARLEGVSAVHDIHVWSISTTDCALTAQAVQRTPWLCGGSLQPLLRDWRGKPLLLFTRRPYGRRGQFGGF